MNYQIKHRFTDALLYELECDSFLLCVEAAIKARADLVDANLAGADLADANLAGACLARADLVDANLARANLAGANLAGADLRNATLSSAILSSAILSGANLGGVAVAAQLGYPDGWAAWTYVATDGTQRVHVGCHDFTVAEGRAYWAGKEDRREVLAALDYAEAIGRLRRWATHGG